MKRSVPELQRSTNLDATLHLPNHLRNVSNGSSQNVGGGTETMLAVLEEFKSATNESFFVANPLLSQRKGGTNLSLAGYQAAAAPPEIAPIVSNVQQIVPEPPAVPINTTSNTITTRENFVKNATASEQTTFNSKMLSTYRGADNMKLKIIDQSVLKTYSNSHNTTMNVKA